MARVIRREAEGLSGEDDTALLRIDDDRLMAGRMAGCRHDTDAGPGLGVSIDLLERGAGKIRDMRKMGVVVLPPRVRKLALLHEDRGPREMAIAARVVGVEVTVGDQLHVGYAVTGGAQRFVDRAHVHRLIEIDHLSRLRREPGVEQEDPALVLDDERRDHNAFAGKAISVGGHRVMPGVDGLDTRMNHRSQTRRVTDLAGFVALAILVIVTPGPDTALTIRNTLVGGRPAGIATAVGVALGQATWSVATSVGVSALVVAAEPAFAALKLAGAAYLMYLGAQSLWSAYRGRSVHPTVDASLPRVRTATALRQGVLSNLTNPKMAVFFPSLLPQFVAADGPAFLPLLELGVVFCLMTLARLRSQRAAHVGRDDEWLAPQRRSECRPTGCSHAPLPNEATRARLVHL